MRLRSARSVFLLGTGLLLALPLLLLGFAYGYERWLVRSEGAGEVGDTDRALSILKERYARGEIDKAEFDAFRRDLG